MIEPGQVVLFSFPRTDLVSGKMRPALVLRKCPGSYDDWLICMISTRLHQAVGGMDERVVEADADFRQSGLKVNSLVRATRLAVVDGSVLEGAIGRIDDDRLRRIRSALARWIEGDV